MVDRIQALIILQNNQPLPNDQELPEELIRSYDEARTYFVENPDPAVIPLFLNSFGEGSGFGVYQLVEDVFSSFSTAQMAPHILNAMRSEHLGVVYWSTQIADLFPDSSLVPQLRDLLRHEKPDIRGAAAAALASIDDSRVNEILATALAVETDPSVKREIKDSIESR